MSDRELFDAVPGDRLRAARFGRSDEEPRHRGCVRCPQIPCQAPLWATLSRHLGREGHHDRGRGVGALHQGVVFRCAVLVREPYEHRGRAVRNVRELQSGNTSRSTSFSGPWNIPFVLTTVATFSSESSANSPRFVRNASRSAKPSGVICFSKPTGVGLCCTPPVRARGRSRWPRGAPRRSRRWP